jgi:hypothetical protein
MRTAIAIATFVVCVFPLTAKADWFPVLPGTIGRVVAAGTQVAVIRRHEVLILREDGHVISRIENADLVTTDEHTSYPQVAEQTLDRLEIPEIDRGSDYTDDLVEDESRLDQRRGWRAGRRHSPSNRTARPVALTASATQIWIASARGIFHVSDDGTPERIFEREWTGTAMVAAGHRLVVDRGESLALLRTEDEPHAVGIPARASHLAISANGKRVAWTAGSNVHLLTASASTNVDVPSDVLDLAFAGETVLALVAQGIVAIPPEGRAELRPAPPGARRLLCPAGEGMPWLALGNGLWMSSNQSQQWSAVPTPKGPMLLDLAVSDHHVWLATSNGLFVSVDAAPARVADAVADSPTRKSHASWLAWFLPKVSVRAAATFAPQGKQLEGFAFAAFPLDAKPLSITAAAWTEELARPTPEKGIAQAAIEPFDPDASCLTVARRKAVELAMTEPERARSYVARAGHAAWLPELRVLVSRRYGRSESLDIDSSSTALSSPLGIDTVNDIRYEARATWDLGRLVFSSEELAAQNQALHMAELRRDIESTMNRLYFERRRLVVTPPAAATDTSSRGIRAKEIEADLDALSSGAFGACVADRTIGAR